MVTRWQTREDVSREDRARDRTHPQEADDDDASPRSLRRRPRCSCSSARGPTSSGRRRSSRASRSPTRRQQRDPWTPPETKLPRFLVRATGRPLRAGLADPRGRRIPRGRGRRRGAGEDPRVRPPRAAGRRRAVRRRLGRRRLSRRHRRRGGRPGGRRPHAGRGPQEEPARRRRGRTDSARPAGSPSGGRSAGCSSARAGRRASSRGRR